MVAQGPLACGGSRSRQRSQEETARLSWAYMPHSSPMSRPFHIEDRARGRIVATGQIDAEGRVVWDETEDSVEGELPDLAAQIEQHLAEGYSGGQLRRPLEWFELFGG